MVVAETIGVGIFLTPATMLRTLQTPGRVFALWAVMAMLTLAGALCYAELSTRYPRAGGMYVYLREAFGARCAFAYGWMALLVVDPGITAALGLGGAQYLLAVVGGSDSALVPVALLFVFGFGVLTLSGIRASGRILRWSALAKLAAVAVLVVAATLRRSVTIVANPTAPLGLGAVAPAVIAAFFAFGGWWDLGRMSEEVATPRRTMPVALIGGVALVAVVYTLTSLALLLAVPAGSAPLSDVALVDLLGTRVFGPEASRVLAAIVVVAVAGSLAAVMLGAPRLYVAMARDRLFPARLTRVNERRGTFPGATAIQVAIASVLVLGGTFNEILGYFVPGAIFFLGLSALALLRLPRPTGSEAFVFRVPWYPLPVLLFLALVVAMLVLFSVGQPRETLVGAAVVALSIPVSRRWIRRVERDADQRWTGRTA
jgi:APA family basic amino acid/polyamine antiporter